MMAQITVQNLLIFKTMSKDVMTSRSKHFSVEEFVRSDTARKLGIDNTPGTFELMNIGVLMDFLDEVREAWGDAIYVTSGYRCKALNDAVGGKPTSGHLYGNAADLKPKGVSASRFWDWLMRWLRRNKKKYDECFIERSKGGVEWVHFALYSATGQQRMKNGQISGF